jgi:hypothetical protein
MALREEATADEALRDPRESPNETMPMPLLERSGRKENPGLRYPRTLSLCRFEADYEAGGDQGDAILPPASPSSISDGVATRTTQSR